MNFESCCVRKRTSPVGIEDHLPHHPTTPTVRPATPAQNHACAPEGGNAGPSCRLVPLGTLGVASRVPVARGTSGESPVALCINRWCRRSHHVRQGAYFASCCDLLETPVHTNPAAGTGIPLYVRFGCLHMALAPGANPFSQDGRYQQVTTRSEIGTLAHVVTPPAPPVDA